MFVIPFWKNWNKKNTYFFLYLSGIFILSISCMVYLQIRGIHSIINWNTLAESEKVNLVINTFNIGPFIITQTADSLVFFQKFEGTKIPINSYSYYLLLVVYLFFTCITLTIISKLKGYSFYIGTGLFSFFLVTLKLDSLLLLSSNYNIGLLICLVVYLSISFAFKTLYPNSTFFKRFLIFFIATLCIGIFFYHFSSIQNPLFYLSTSLTSATTFLSIIFIIIIGHEIVSIFAYLSFQNSTTSPKKNLTKFLVISTIYLLNISLLYLLEKNYIDWNILYINAYLILSFSGIIGIWGFRSRAILHENIFKFNPDGGLIYLMMGIVTFSTIIHFHLTSNDVGLEIIKDFIIMSHLGFGISFVLYVISNTPTLVDKNIPFIDGLYRPKNMPFLSFRLFGIVIILALLFLSNWKVPIFQNKSSNLNAVADYHLSNQEILLATKYLEEASKYGLNNHKSNYHLGKIYDNKKQKQKAKKAYKAAIKKYPSPQSFINLSNLYEENDNFFDALFNLNSAKKIFTDHSNISNNLGLLFNKTNIIDSAVFYFDKNIELNNQDESGFGNLLATLSKNNILISIDSIQKNYNSKKGLISLNNEILYHTLSNRDHYNNNYTNDTILSTIQMALVTNKTLNSLIKKDTLDINFLETLIENPKNDKLREAILYLKCLHLYKNRRVSESFRLLNYLANTSTKYGGKYFDDLGIWSLKEGAYDVAITYFELAIEQEYEDAKFHLAIALTENHKINQAIKHWENIKKSNYLTTTAEKILEILKIEPKKVTAQDDNFKYLYSRYRIPLKDTLIFYNLYQTIKEPNYRAATLLYRMEQLWKNNKKVKASNEFNNLEISKVNDQKLLTKIRLFKLKILNFTKKINYLNDELENSNVIRDNYLEFAYYNAQIMLSKNDSTKTKEYYQYIADKNPFFVESIISTADFYKLSSPVKAYNILLNATEINPNCVEILEQYIYQCARIRQENYGKIGLEKLKKLSSYETYLKVSNRFDELLKLGEI